MSNVSKSMNREWFTILGDDINNYMYAVYITTNAQRIHPDAAHAISKYSLETSIFEELGFEFINFACNCAINTLRLIGYLTGFSICI